MKQSRHRYGDPGKAPSLFLTPDDLLLLKKALLPLEQLIVTNPKPFPNIQLVQETLTQVQAKLSRMMEQGVYGNTIPFLANEVVILHAAVRLFLVNGGWQTDSPETYEALKLSLIL
ncbi:MAG: hypothetical protein JO202_13730 [Ktedonobacteraceae bacterium]|nr:hypothetical protein [Ktedonobacteraceae bacterium]